ncbi:MAG: hypothetical protein ACRDTA_29700 [Pseudonocardiaceae bacterium]
MTELARVNRDVAPLAMRIMEGSAGAAEQQHYGQRLIAAGRRLCRRADEASRLVIAGEAVVDDRLALPVNTIEPHWEP